MCSFKRKDEASFRDNTVRFVSLLTYLDRLLDTRDELTFSSHIRQAMENSCCEKHKEIFRKNEVALHTIWGPFENIELFDYAWKEWSGLVKDYYLPRWKMFFDILKQDFMTDGSHISDTPFNHNERNDYDTTEFQKKLRDFEFGFIDSYQGTEPSGESTIDVVKELVAIM